jgi:hypothetical protein
MANQSIIKRNLQTIVLVDKDQPQIFNFDKRHVFDERLINKTLAVELSLEDEQKVVTAETSLLFPNQIRIICAKTVPLIEGSTVQLNLTAVYNKLEKEYFLNIPCTAGKVENYQNVTHAILSFNEQVDPQFIDWYQKWLAKLQEAHKSEEIDESSFHFIYQYYKRLYAAHLTHPVLLSNSRQIQHAFTSRQYSENVSFTNENNIEIEFPLNIFQPYIKHQDTEIRTPLYVWYENNQIFYFSNADHPKVSSKKIIGWLIKKPQWRILLICNRKIVPVDEIESNDIEQYVNDEIVASSTYFKESFSELTTTTHIINISCLFEHIKLPEYSEQLSANTATNKEIDIIYQVPSFQVKRVEHRFDYSTEVALSTLYLPKNITLSSMTSDISFLGLGLIIPLADYPFKKHDSVMIEFTQWNEEFTSSLFKKKEQLESFEYTITTITKKQYVIVIGLKRIKRDAEPTQNSFIRNKLNEIEKSRAGSIHNNFDLYQSLVSSLWITQNIAGLAFFLGRDSEGIRIIQAIVSTQENLKIRNPHQTNNDWSFLQKIAISLDVTICKMISDKSNSSTLLNIGVYCYFDDKCEEPEWKTQTDLDFQSIENKSKFINIAMSYKKHFFYHCSLIPISPGKDDILKGESSSFVSLAAHRLKEIHEICRHLIAVGELNDVTRLIEFMHK